MKKVGGHFIADGSAVNIDIGFIPDKFVAWEGMEETNPDMHVWHKEQANTANGNGQYGLLLTGSTGVVTKHAAAANGFAEYDTGADRVLVDSPAPGVGDVEATVADWAASTTATARSATTIGTIVRPTTKNGYVYECTTGGTTNDTEGEPTWPTTLGDTVTETDGVVWTCREENTVRGGAKGLTLGATGSTDGDEWTWEAELWDRVKPEQDAASYDPVNQQER
jgi:hypothetical protein